MTLHDPRFLLTAFTVVLVSCGGGGETPGEQDRTPFDRDNRLDWYAEPSDQWREIAKRSVLAIVPANLVDESDPTNVTISAGTLEEDFGVCSDQRFADQMVAADCSGTLIASDLVLTAGHCIGNISDCNRYRYVFHHYLESPAEPARVTGNDVYACSDLMVSRADSTGADYAIVKLDRPVTPDKRAVSARRSNSAMSQGTLVTAIGNPSGLPLKITSGGTVVDGRSNEMDFFSTDLDIFGGDSGSGVYTDEGELIGITVRATEPPYIPSLSDPSCDAPNIDPEGPRSSDVTYAAKALEDLCSTHPSEGICDGSEIIVPPPKPANPSSDELAARCTVDGFSPAEFPAVITPQEAMVADQPIAAKYVVSTPFQFEGAGQLTFKLEGGKPAVAFGTMEAPTKAGTWVMTCVLGDKAAAPGRPGTNPGTPGDNTTTKNITNLSDKKGGTKHIEPAIEVPANAKSLRVEISGGTGDADLYLRRGSAPTLEAFDCRPLKSGSAERCFFFNPKPGNWYVMLHAIENYEGVNLTIEIETKEESPNQSVDPNAYYMECKVDLFGGLVIGIAVTTADDIEDGQEATVSISFPGPFDLDLTGAFSFAFDGLIPVLAVGAAETVLGLLGFDCAITDWPDAIDGGPGSGPGGNGEGVFELAASASGGVDSRQAWTLEVPQGTTRFTVQASPGTGDADLYIKFGEAPIVGPEACPERNPATDPSTARCHNTDPNWVSAGIGPELVIVNNPQPGTWHVLLRGFEAFSGFKVTYEIVK